MREFNKLVDGSARGDSYEGVSSLHQPDRLISLIVSYHDGEGIQHSIDLKKDLAGPVRIHQNGFNDFNLFCLYAVKSQELEGTWETEEERVSLFAEIEESFRIQTAICEEIASFGEYAVLIHNVREFVDRVHTAAQHQEISCASQLVSYYDPENFSGDFEGIESIFNKRNSYAYQSEYRFAFRPRAPSGAIKIIAGSLSDIALRLPAKELGARVQLGIRLHVAEGET